KKKKKKANLDIAMNSHTSIKPGELIIPDTIIHHDCKMMEWHNDFDILLPPSSPPLRNNRDLPSCQLPTHGKFVKYLKWLSGQHKERSPEIHHGVLLSGSGIIGQLSQDSTFVHRLLFVPNTSGYNINLTSSGNDDKISSTTSSSRPHHHNNNSNSNINVGPGAAVSGEDIGLSNNRIDKQFNIIACDRESAAVAQMAHRLHIPFCVCKVAIPKRLEPPIIEQEAKHNIVTHDLSASIPLLRWLLKEYVPLGD
ncbi:hypothetical protein RFI_27048, partial [Reticulomyxa filosa]